MSHWLRAAVVLVWGFDMPAPLLYALYEPHSHVVRVENNWRYAGDGGAGCVGPQLL